MAGVRKRSPGRKSVECKLHCSQPESVVSLPPPLLCPRSQGKAGQGQCSTPGDHQGTEHLLFFLPPTPAGSLHMLIARRLLYLPASCLYSKQKEGALSSFLLRNGLPWEFCLLLWACDLHHMASSSCKGCWDIKYFYVRILPTQMNSSF